MAVAVRFEAETEEKIDEYIQNYMWHYPYAGYMTMVNTKYYDEEKELWVAKMSRLHSCD